jgi:superfamily II DNA or RNA helicase
MKQLRYYQRQALTNAKNDIAKKIYNLVVQMPTGTGKSMTQNHFAEELAPIEEARTIFIGGFKRDLCVQAMEGFKENYPACAGRVSVGNKLVNGIGLVMGSDGDDVSARIIIASAQTLTPSTLNDETAIENELVKKEDLELLPNGGVRLSKKSKRRYLVSPRYDRILEHGVPRLWEHDEAHHAPADSTLFIIMQTREIIRLLGLPPLINIGFTATPVRNDGVAMSNVYDRITYRLQDKTATEEGYILPVREDVIRVSIMSEEKTTHQFKAAVNWTDMVIKAWEDHLKSRDCTAFFVGPIDGMGAIDASKKLRQAFQDHGVKAVHVDAGGVIDTDGTQLSNKHRKRIYNEIRAGQIPVICNFDIIGEGIDLPIIDSVAFLRKVNEVNCTQIVGRARRRFGNQTEAWIMDFTGQTVVVGVVGEMTGVKKDIFGQPLPVEQTDEKEDDENETRDTGENIRNATKLGWVHGADNVYSYDKVQRRSAMMWYLHHNGDMSLACSRFDYKAKTRGDALLITSPDWNEADRYAAMLETDISGPLLDTVQAMHVLRSNFIMWHTRSLYTKTLINGHEVREQEIVYPADPTQNFHIVSGSLDDIEEFAALYAQQIPGYDPSIASKKNKRWRAGTMTDLQLPLFKALCPKLLPEKYSSGEAGQLITYTLSSTVVHNLIKNAEAGMKQYV